MTAEVAMIPQLELTSEQQDSYTQLYQVPSDAARCASTAASNELWCCQLVHMGSIQCDSGLSCYTVNLVYRFLAEALGLPEYKHDARSAITLDLVAAMLE
jgi:hypothetical protein